MLIINLPALRVHLKMKEMKKYSRIRLKCHLNIYSVRYCVLYIFFRLIRNPRNNQRKFAKIIKSTSSTRQKKKIVENLFFSGHIGFQISNPICPGENRF